MSQQFFDQLSYASRATLGLLFLRRIADLDERVGSAAPAAVKTLFRVRGGRNERTSLSGRESAPPYEYSVAALGEEIHLRLFVKPLRPTGETSDSDSWDAGWSTLRRLERSGRAALADADNIASLLLPSKEKEAAYFGLCLGAAFGANGIQGVKAYFDGFTNGLEGNVDLVKSFLARLGYATESMWIRNELTFRKSPILSLDVTGTSDARCKIYTPVTETTVSSLEERCATLPTYKSGDATRLLGCVTPYWQTVLKSPGPRPLLCWSFTREDRGRPTGLTLYVPFNTYQPDLTQAVKALRNLGSPSALTEALLAVGSARSSSRMTSSSNPSHWLAQKFGSARGSTTLYFNASLVEDAALSSLPIR